MIKPECQKPISLTSSWKRRLAHALPTRARSPHISVSCWADWGRPITCSSTLHRKARHMELWAGGRSPIPFVPRA